MTTAPAHQLAQRQAVVVVQDAAVEFLRMTFKVERSIKKDPNTCEVSIWNVAPETLARMQERHATVLLSAGHAGHLGQLFKGNARSVLPVKDKTGWVAKVECGDGGTAYSYGRTNQAFAPGTKIVDALGGVAKSASIGIGNAYQAFQKGGLQAGFDSFVHGFTSSGDAQSDIDAICRTAGFTWSIQDGELQILTTERDTTGEAEVLSVDTGLVGSPEMGSHTRKHGPALLKVKALLRPQVRPGGVVQVDSRAIHGQFRAEKVTHEGDTWGGDWFTTIEARAL